MKLRIHPEVVFGEKTEEIIWMVNLVSILIVIMVMNGASIILALQQIQPPEPIEELHPLVNLRHRL